MKTMTLMLAGATLICAGAGARPDCPEAECEKTRQKIRTIESKLRQGYTRAEGERLEARLHELRAIRAKLCR